MNTYQNFINGKFVPSAGGTLDVNHFIIRRLEMLCLDWS